jgi:hypothetical protein
MPGGNPERPPLARGDTGFGGLAHRTARTTIERKIRLLQALRGIADDRRDRAALLGIVGGKGGRGMVAGWHGGLPGIDPATVHRPSIGRKTGGVMPGRAKVNQISS